MGNLLDSAIKMQGSTAGGTATINIVNYDGMDVSWYKNGVFQAGVLTTLTATINAGDTFYITGFDDSPAPAGVSIYYYLNTVFVNQYFGNPSVTTPTFTAVGGNTYKFDCYQGA